MEQKTATALWLASIGTVNIITNDSWHTFEPKHTTSTALARHKIASLQQDNAHRTRAAEATGLFTQLHTQYMQKNADYPYEYVK